MVFGQVQTPGPVMTLSFAVCCVFCPRELGLQRGPSIVLGTTGVQLGHHHLCARGEPGQGTERASRRAPRPSARRQGAPCKHGEDRAEQAGGWGRGCLKERVLELHCEGEIHLFIQQTSIYCRPTVCQVLFWCTSESSGGFD